MQAGPGAGLNAYRPVSSKNQLRYDTDLHLRRTHVVVVQPYGLLLTCSKFVITSAN